MPYLTFPITSAGLIVDVLVNVEAAVLLPLRASGQTRSPIQAKGEIDSSHQDRPATY